MDEHEYPNLRGLYEVEFVNRMTRTLDVKKVWVDTKAYPIYLETVTGRMYFFHNIISIQKKYHDG